MSVAACRFLQHVLNEKQDTVSVLRIRITVLIKCSFYEVWNIMAATVNKEIAIQGKETKKQGWTRCNCCYLTVVICIQPLHAGWFDCSWKECIHFETAAVKSFATSTCGGGWTGGLATFLVLYCHSSISASNVTYCGYITEIGFICIPKELEMFQRVIFNVTQSRVEGKTISFHWFSYLIIVVYRNLDKMKLSDSGHIWAQLC